MPNQKGDAMLQMNGNQTVASLSIEERIRALVELLQEAVAEGESCGSKSQ